MKKEEKVKCQFCEAEYSNGYHYAIHLVHKHYKDIKEPFEKIFWDPLLNTLEEKEDLSSSQPEEQVEEPPAFDEEELSSSPATDPKKTTSEGKKPMGRNSIPPVWRIKTNLPSKKVAIELVDSLKLVMKKGQTTKKRNNQRFYKWDAKIYDGTEVVEKAEWSMTIEEANDKFLSIVNSSER